MPTFYAINSNLFARHTTRPYRRLQNVRGQVGRSCPIRRGNQFQLLFANARQRQIQTVAALAVEPQRDLIDSPQCARGAHGVHAASRVLSLGTNVIRAGGH